MGLNTCLSDYVGRCFLQFLQKEIHRYLKSCTICTKKCDEYHLNNRQKTKTQNRKQAICTRLCNHRYLRPKKDILFVCICLVKRNNFNIELDWILLIPHKEYLAALRNFWGNANIKMWRIKFNRFSYRISIDGFPAWRNWSENNKSFEFDWKCDFHENSNNCIFCTITQEFENRLKYQLGAKH